MEGNMSVQPTTAKRAFAGEAEGSNKRQKTESEVNGKQYIVIAPKETDLRPVLADLTPSSTASLNAKVVEILKTASDLSQIKRSDQIRDDEAPIHLFEQAMDYISPIELSPDGTIAEIEFVGATGLKLFQFMVGYSYLEKKEYSKAESCFKKVGQDDRRYLCAQLGLASCFFFEGDYDQSIQYADSASKTDAARDSAQYKMGCCYAKKKEYSKAIDQFLSVRKPLTSLEAPKPVCTNSDRPLFDPEARRLIYDAAQFNLGCCFYNQGEDGFTKAASHFELVVGELDGKNPRYDAAQYYLGLIHVAQKEPGKAQQCFSHVRKGSLFYVAARVKLQELEKRAV
jgi:tetratricopeptide (TPR) repeat protein